MPGAAPGTGCGLRPDRSAGPGPRSFPPHRAQRRSSRSVPALSPMPCLRCPVLAAEGRVRAAVSRPSAVLPSGAAPGSGQLRAPCYWHPSGIGREKDKDCSLSLRLRAYWRRQSANAALCYFITSAARKELTNERSGRIVEVN